MSSHRKLGRRRGRIVNVTCRRDRGVESLPRSRSHDPANPSARPRLRLPEHIRAAATAGISAPHLWPDRCANPLPGRSQGAGPASFSPDHCAPRIIAVRVRRWAQGTRPTPSAAKFGAACGAARPRHGPRPATGTPARAVVGSGTCAAVNVASQIRATALVVVATQGKIWLPRIIWGAELRE